MIRLTVPSIEQDDLDAVAAVLATRQLVQGARVAEFEERVASYVSARHAVAVTNCTSALFLALAALDVGRGDRVAVATYSWPATANAIELCGASPVFVDIDAATFSMSPDRLATALAGSRVKAILPVHAFGGMADMPRLRDIADAYGIPIIEDAACALGSTLHGKPAGSWGIAGCFSFHPRKAITTGEGGIVATDDAALAKRLRMLRNHGQDPDAPAPDFVTVGHNMRMTEFQGALGTSQMAKLERVIAGRRACAARYERLLVDTPLHAPKSLPDSRHVYQSYVVLLPASSAARRSRIISALREGGIETTIGTYHIPLTRYFRERYGFAPGAFPVTDDIATRAVSLPLYEGLTGDQQRQVVAALIAEMKSSEHAAESAD
jgi:dTDP-4-amino-4,6-dideoxygalactose transaminase